MAILNNSGELTLTNVDHKPPLIRVEPGKNQIANVIIAKGHGGRHPILQVLLKAYSVSVSGKLSVSATRVFHCPAPASGIEVYDTAERGRDVSALTIRTKHLIERLRAVDPHAVDALLALAFTAAALWTVARQSAAPMMRYRDDDVFGIALLLLQTLPIAARRVAPLAALSVSVTAISLHIGYWV